MKILILDKDGQSIDFGMRCLEWGHEVKMYISDNKYGDIGDGLVPKIKSWKPWMDWADLIFLPDNLYYLNELAVYFAKGYPIFGPTKEASELELQRTCGQEAFEKCGIKTIPSQEFKNYKDAMAYVKANADKRFVSKPNGDADKSLSYVSKDSGDMLYMLEKWSKANTLKDTFIIQDFIKGIEMAVGGWFGPHGFNKYVNENWEFKKLLAGDKGPATGEMGTVMRYTQDSLLAEKVLYPLEPLLHKMAYTGYIDVNCMIAPNGTPYPMEFTCRPGWPHFNIVQALHKGDPAQWMLDLINGKDTLRVKEKIACGVVLAQPDFPYSKLPIADVTGTPVYGVTDDICEYVHPCQVKKGKAPVYCEGKLSTEDIWVSNGTYILITSGVGSTVCEAKDNAYKIMDKISIPNSPMYRTDIGCRLEKQLEPLHKMGYGIGMEY